MIIKDSDNQEVKIESKWIHTIGVCVQESTVYTDILLRIPMTSKKRSDESEGPPVKKPKVEDSNIVPARFSNTSGANDKISTLPNKKGPKCSVPDCKNVRDIKKADPSGMCKQHLALRDEPQLVCTFQDDKGHCLKPRQGKTSFCKKHAPTVRCPTCDSVMTGDGCDACKDKLMV